MKKTKDYITLQFSKFAISIGAMKDTNHKDIDIPYLLEQSFLLIMQKKVLTKKQEHELNIFKDRYNRYLQYCVDNDIVIKDVYEEVKKLNTILVPDMSHIKIPNITEELKEMDIDFDNLVNVFGKL